MTVAYFCTPSKLEEGEYGVVLVATTIEAAVRAVKARYTVAPYIVRWDEVRDTSLNTGRGLLERWTLIGHFEAVQGYSIKHTAEYVIEPYDLLA